jgi:hypothetical protein
MSLIFTLPGKIGDSLMQWPVARRYCIEQQKKCELWLDEGTLKPLVSLFEVQPEVEKVKLIPGIQHYQCGGQPFDFGLTTEDFIGHELHHLGMRWFPQRQITLQTMEWVPFHLQNKEALAQEPSLHIPEPITGNRVVLHGNFQSHMSGTPGFWRFLKDHWDELGELFEERCFVGTDEEVDRAREVYPDATGFKDGGNMLQCARLVAGSRCVIGCGSSIAVLGGALKVPTLRIHDAIADHPKVLWANLGANQLNETERDLRKMWPAWRDQWIAPVPA